MKPFSSFKSIDEQINEVLSKDASAGEWIHDFVKSDNPKFAGKSAAKRKEMALAAYYAKQRNEATLQPNGTDKVEPDAGMCSVCGAKDCEEHKDYISPAVTGYVKESTPYYNKPSFLNKMGRMAKQERLAREKKEAEQKQIKESAEHTVHVDDGSKYGEEPHQKDVEHVMAGVKKHNGKFDGHSDKGAYFKFGSRTDAKNFADHVKKAPHRSVSADLHESRGHKILATAMANAERMKTVQIPTPAERKAELEKRNKETQMKEATENHAPVAPSLTRHIVAVHVSDPDAPHEGKQKKALAVLTTHPKSAEATARKHFEKKGWTVHSVKSNNPVHEEVELEEAKDYTILVQNGKHYLGHKEIYDGNQRIEISKEKSDKLYKAGATRIVKEETIEEAKDTVEKDASGKIKSWSHEGDWEKMSTKKQGTGKAANLAGKALQKTKTLNTEEVELEEAWEVYDTKTRAIHSTHPTQRKAQNAMNKLNDKHPGYETPGNLIASKFGARVAGLKEESIDEAAQDTLGQHKVMVTVSDPNHQAVSQRKERVMKRVVVKALGRDEAKAKAEEFYKKKGYKVHESEYHSKVPSATMKTEEVSLDEAKEMTHAQVLAKIKSGTHEAVTDVKVGKHVELRNNSTGKSTHVYVKEDIEVDKLTKEETTMVTYKEFMASIDEGRIDDLKDKLAADREKRLNKMDYSKEKDAKKNPVTKVKGHSYGAGDEDGEAETAKPAEPAEKRGRGRPAGSKSGARA